MTKKRIKIIVIIILSPLLLFLAYKALSYFTFWLAMKEQNQEQFEEWYKNDYLPSEYVGVIAKKEDLGEGDIWLLVDDIPFSASISYRFMKQENKEFYKNVFINDTIKKVSGRNRIYLIENGTRTKSYEIKFLYEH